MSESFPSTSDPLTSATQLVKNGRLEEAKEVLTRYLMQNPSSEQGWLLMSFVLSDAAKQKDCLERVLKINPNNTVAQSRLAHLLGKRTEELFLGKGKVPPPTPPPPKREVPAERIPIPPITLEQRSSGADVDGSQPAEVPIPSIVGADLAPMRGMRPALSGKWVRIIIIALIILIVGIIGALLYFGVIAPAISHLSITSTPTPQIVIVPTLPPAWTNTLTPTVTLTEVPTLTPTVTPTLPPTATPTKSKPTEKKP